MKKKSSIRFFVVRDFQFLRWKPIKSPDTWRCLQLIDPSQTYQILKHYYQYLSHTSNPNQIPRRYQRKLPTNLSLWTATSWRGSICCTAVTQTKSRDMPVRDQRRLDTEALPKMSDCSSQKRTEGSNVFWCSWAQTYSTSHWRVSRKSVFLESLYFGFWRVAEVSRFWVSPNAPLLQKKKNKKTITPVMQATRPSFSPQFPRFCLR